LNKPERLLTKTKENVENSVHIGKGKIKKERERFKSAMKAGMNAYKIEKED